VILTDLGLNVLIFSELLKIKSMYSFKYVFVELLLSLGANYVDIV
jgi:hypothetical protein